MSKPNFKAEVNDSFEFEKLDLEQFDVVTLEDKKSFHIIKDNQSYKAELIETNFQGKRYLLKINGRTYQVQLKDEKDILINKLGLSVVSDQQVKEVKAPMPGQVLEILVEVGQEVDKGTPLLILEAMKMENIIKSAGQGVVKEIHIIQKKAVEKNAVLITME